MTAPNSSETIALDEGGDVRLPVVELLTGRGFITGKSGSGKSNTASVVVEELLDRGFPVLIVDTDGEYWGLKEEYEILHVGADEECDLQVGAVAVAGVRIDVGVVEVPVPRVFPSGVGDLAALLFQIQWTMEFDRYQMHLNNPQESNEADSHE